MKIKQEAREFALAQTAQDRPGDGSEARARDFAAKQNQASDSFLAALPEEGSSAVESPSRRTEEAEAGMEMSERFREEGGQIYLSTEN